MAENSNFWLGFSFWEKDLPLAEQKNEKKKRLNTRKNLYKRKPSFKIFKNNKTKLPPKY